MAGLIDSLDGLCYQEGTGLQSQPQIGMGGLDNSTADTGLHFLLLADGTDFLLLTTGSDDKLILAN